MQSNCKCEYTDWCSRIDWFWRYGPPWTLHTSSIGPRLPCFWWGHPSIWLRGWHSCWWLYIISWENVRNFEWQADDRSKQLLSKLIVTGQSHIDYVSACFQSILRQRAKGGLLIITPAAAETLYTKKWECEGWWCNKVISTLHYESYIEIVCVHCFTLSLSAM